MTDNLKIIGLGGTNGSGKDTVGELLASGHNFLFVSVTDMMRKECLSRGLSVERVNLRMISAEWRKESGLGAAVDKAVNYYNQQQKDYQGLVIASIRNPGENDRIHELGGQVWWVDANPKLRYERVTSGNRGRDAEDSISYEQFIADENAEMYAQAGADSTGLNGDAVRKLSDANLMNQSTLEDLKSQINELLI